ncbi:MAG TPA: hypothetical protein VNP98_02970 [Chthoniobacterales bacterium]|nr:hypothetical protein [Chthoniobacterales bacterium]
MSDIPAQNLPHQSNRPVRSTSAPMTEDEYRRKSLGLQKIGMMGALIGAVFALWQYNHSSRKQFEAPVWQKQVELYTSATETIARLAFTKDEREWNDARLRFWELYAGSLILVEDQKVANGMIEFSKMVRAAGDDPSGRAQNFENKAISLSYTFRHSIEQSVGVGLPAVSDTKSQATQ